MVKAKPAPILDVERLLALVPFISAHQGISIKDLASTFNVTPNQISADLTTLWMCGLPGYTALELMDLSFDSGYVTIRNAETLQIPRALNFDECISLIFGLDLVKNALSEKSELHPTIDALVKRLAEKSGLTTALRATNPVSAGLRATIESALTSNLDLVIDYHSLYRDEITKRTITPLEIRIDNGIEYLFAYCHTANAFRVFRLDRISEATLRQVSESHRKNLTVKSDDQLECEIRITSRLRLMSERFSLENPVLSAQHKIRAYSHQWVVRSIFASAGSCELVSPTPLRAEIALKAQLILDRYIQPEHA
jgi:proteasome accessory factor C